MGSPNGQVSTSVQLATALFESRHSTDPLQTFPTWDELAESLARHYVFEAKSRAPLWSPVLYRPGAQRKREGIEHISLFVADIDDGTSARSLSYWLDGLECVVASTWSHTPEQPKLRVVLPLLEPIPVDDYDSAWRRINQHLFRGHVDPSTKDPARMFYTPSCPAERLEYAYNERWLGAWLDWRALPPVEDPVLRRRAAPSVPDPSTLNELAYRARCCLAKWTRELEAMPPQSGRHNALLSKARAAGGLVAAGLLDMQEAEIALLGACEANGLTRDPEGAAERTLRDGLEYGQTQPWTPDQLPDSPAWRARLEAPRIGAAERAKSPLSPQRVSWLTAREVAALVLPEMAWIVRPWIPEAALVEIDGKVKAAGKTTFLFAMLGAALDGEPFMGEPTQRTPVVLLTEQTPRSLQQALVRAGLEQREDLHVLMWVDARRMSWPEIVAVALERVRQVGARLLAIDTLSQFVSLHGDRENNAGDAMQAVGPLQEATGQGISVVFTRHERKSGGDVGDSGRGSSAYAGAVDVIMSLRRGTNDIRHTVRHVLALSRFDETPQMSTIELQGNTYVSLGDDERAQRETVALKVLEELGTCEEDALQTYELQDLVRASKAQMSRALTALVQAGRVVRLGRGRTGDAYRYYRVLSEEDVDDLS